jgi:hypothetical protein
VEADRKLVRLEVQRFARRLCRRFPQAFAREHCLSTKEDVIHWLRAALPPHAGRPPKASVTQAVELRGKGTAWSDIYAECIPGYRSLNWTVRRVEIARLRNAVRSRARLTRIRHKKNVPSVSHAENN